MRTPYAAGVCALAFLAAVGAGEPAPGQHAFPPSTYILGVDDQITLHVLEADEISNKPVRVDANGFIRLPMVGQLRAAGLTLDQLQAALTSRLKTFINEPDVAVSITEYRSQPVSILGAVRSPGVHQLQGRKTLVEILSLAGGLSDEAGYIVTITRSLDWGRIPLPSAKDDNSGRFSVASVALPGILEARRPEENVVVMPNDVVSVPRGKMVYVTGQVNKAGGFVLREQEALSVLQALTLAGGTSSGASPQNARILRPGGQGTEHSEIPVDLNRIMIAKGADVPLQAGDILFVPANAPKKALLRAAEAAIQIGTGLAIYRR